MGPGQPPPGSTTEYQSWQPSPVPESKSSVEGLGVGPSPWDPELGRVESAWDWWCAPCCSRQRDPQGAVTHPVDKNAATQPGHTVGSAVQCWDPATVRR